MTRIYSVADMLRSNAGGAPIVRHRPFRAPHHTISHAGLVGGGRWPRPGEISLAHRGVLFLDEIPEFATHTLEVLRQPLEDKVVTISRAQEPVVSGQCNADRRQKPMPMRIFRRSGPGVHL